MYNDEKSSLSLSCELRLEVQNDGGVKGEVAIETMSSSGW